jgi:hypothetical protein
VLDGKLSTSANPVSYDSAPGLKLAISTADEDAGTRSTLDNWFGWGARSDAPPFDLGPPMPTVSPRLARAMVSYREMRPIREGASDLLAVLPTEPGFLSVGQLSDVLARMNVSVDAPSGSGTTTVVAPPITVKTVTGLSEYQYLALSTSPERPYSYMGYLQLVAPLVRLQDWATVKDHVFTIYMTQGDGSGTWTHTEVTVDRTRCLYTNDPPARVAETPPISYYNVVNDQK